jgi:antirestriction protein ArdC
MCMNINHITKQPYKGKNQTKLEEARAERGYNRTEWITFVQARQIGMTVKKGEHGVKIFTMSSGDEENRGRPVGLKTVFNVEQTEAINSRNN